MRPPRSFEGAVFLPRLFATLPGQQIPLRAERQGEECLHFCPGTGTCSVHYGPVLVRRYRWGIFYRSGNLITSRYDQNSTFGYHPTLPLRQSTLNDWYWSKAGSA